MPFTTIDLTKAVTGVLPDANANYSTPRKNAKPLIINGNMAVAQRGTSFSQPNTNNNAFPVDRFTFQTGSIGAYTSTQETLTSGNAYNSGFRNASRIDCTTADASPSGGDYFWFQYTMEAQDCLVFKKGTSNAEKMTVAFWVKSNKTGTSQLTVKDSDNDRQVAGTYTISSANTWEHKVINLPADTTGAINNDNGAGLRFEWWLGGGSSYTSGSVPTTWEARVDADRGVQNLAINDSTSNDWSITGIQVEVGEFTSATLPPFQHESYDENFERCIRYHFEKLVGTNIHGYDYTGSTNDFIGTIHFPKLMRATPTVDAAQNSYSFGSIGTISNEGFTISKGSSGCYAQRYTANCEL
tara:strand:+ start:32 stop:1096 length:1065 start_codon:yes stop_codon:yes gene_type:complete